MNNQDKISVLLVGGSQQGKSEFIMSMTDNSVREKIQPSGKGQTTRTSMIYNIYFSDKTEENKPVELSIKVTLKSQKEFCKERMDALEKALTTDSLFADLQDEYYFDDSFEILKNSTIHDSAFFDCKEFGEEIANEITDGFESGFNQGFWKALPKDLFSDSVNTEDSEEISNSEKEFDKNFKDFFNSVYDKGYSLILKSLNNNDDPKNNIIINENEKKGNVSFFLDVQNREAEYISRYFKTKDGEISYSSLVKSIDIQCKGFEGYSDIMSKNRISCISMVDTYGLDHSDSSMNDDLLVKRYRELFKEFSDIKAVLLIQKMWDRNNDFSSYIVKLFDAEPAVVPFIILNKADEESESSSMSKNKGIIERSITPIKRNLKKKGVSENLANWRANLVSEYSIPYCSILEVPEYAETIKDRKDDLHKQNRNGIEKIFSAIRFKKYLGNAFIPIDKLSDPDTIKKLLDVKTLFNWRAYNARKIPVYEYDFVRWPNRTKGALRKRFNEEKRLGFASESGYYDGDWDDFVIDSLQFRFKSEDLKNNLTELLTETLICDDETKSQTITDITHSFLVFAMNVLYKDITEYLYVSKFDRNVISSRIMETLYNDKKDIIDILNTKCKVGETLNRVYDFEHMEYETINTLLEIFKDTYLKYLVPIFRSSNARKLAKELGDVSFVDINDANQANAIFDYIDKYDSKLRDDHEGLNYFLSTITDFISK